MSASSYSPRLDPRQRGQGIMPQHDWKVYQPMQPYRAYRPPDSNHEQLEAPRSPQKFREQKPGPNSPSARALGRQQAQTQSCVAMCRRKQWKSVRESDAVNSTSTDSAADGDGKSTSLSRKAKATEELDLHSTEIRRSRNDDGDTVQTGSARPKSVRASSSHSALARNLRIEDIHALMAQELLELKRENQAASERRGAHDDVGQGLEVRSAGAHEQNNEEIPSSVEHKEDKAAAYFAALRALEEQAANAVEMATQRHTAQKWPDAKIPDRSPLDRSFFSKDQDLNTPELIDKTDFQLDKRDMIKTQDFVEEASLRQIELVQQAIEFCIKLLPREPEKVEEKPEIQYNNPRGSTVLLAKACRKDPLDSVPTRRRKPKANKAGTHPGAPIKHDLRALLLFDKVQVDIPITLDDVPMALAELEALEGKQLAALQACDSKSDKKRLQLSFDRAQFLQDDGPLRLPTVYEHEHFDCINHDGKVGNMYVIDSYAEDGQDGSITARHFAAIDS